MQILIPKVLTLFNNIPFKIQPNDDEIIQLHDNESDNHRSKRKCSIEKSIIII
jgi:hypothetical protein